MTPAYASPEQLRSEPVTILSDVYQMGLLLYLLLTGRTPYRWASSSSPLDLARAIADDPPAAPRKALLSPPDGEEDPLSAEEIARRRRTTVSRLARTLEGDLGSILLMALRKEPERRYGSVSQLKEDLERFLDGYTVRARPDSLGYRLRVFSRRHRFAVLFGGLLAVSLVAFSVLMGIQAREVAQERDRASREAEISAQVSSFLTDLFQVADPGESRGNTVTAREILDLGREELEERMPEPSLARARLRRTIGQVYENLGLYPEALVQYEMAWETVWSLGEETSPEAMDLQLDLGRILIALSRYEEAEELILDALETRRNLLGPEHPRTLEAASSMASLRFLQGEPAEAEARFRRVLEAQQRARGEGSPAALQTTSSLASTLFYQGRLEEAEPLYREALEGLEEELGKNHPQTLKVASNLGSIWVQQQRFKEAEPLLRETLAGRARVLGDSHPGTLNAMGNLAGLLADRGDRAEAEILYRKIYESHLEALGPDHRKTADALWNLGWVASLDPGRLGESAQLYTEALEVYRRSLGSGHGAINDTLYHLAVVEARRGELNQALNRLEQAVEGGYAGRAVLSEEAFAPLAERPRMKALLETVGNRREARRAASARSE